jgi:hypothetical protein
VRYSTDLVSIILLPDEKGSVIPCLDEQGFPNWLQG